MEKRKGIFELRGEKLAEDPEFSRRDLLATGMNGVSAVLATTIVGKIAHDRAASVMPEGRPLVAANDEAPERAAPETMESAPRTMTPEGMVGMTLSPLEQRYIGWSAPLPKELPPIAFPANLERMLADKGQLVDNRPNAGMQRAYYDRLGQDYAQRFNEGTTHTMSLAEFRETVRADADQVREALEPSYPRIVRTYLSGHLDALTLDPEEKGRYETWLARALKQLAERITPDIMLAYVATELMPAPERGIELMDFMLKTAGTEFLERIPALGDAEFSYGPLQLTEGNVVGPDGSVTNLLRVMGRDDLVPDSLEQFDSIDDHMRAGFLFAFYNTLALVQDVLKRGKPEEVVTLLESADTETGSGRSAIFLGYLAAAHHRPAVAREAMETWLDANQGLPKTHRAHSLAGSFGDTHADREVRTYAQKSERYSLNLRRFLA